MCFFVLLGRAEARGDVYLARGCVGLRNWFMVLGYRCGGEIVWG